MIYFYGHLLSCAFINMIFEKTSSLMCRFAFISLKKMKSGLTNQRSVIGQRVPGCEADDLSCPPCVSLHLFGELD
jgi:hypothetical protein